MLGDVVSRVLAWAWIPGHPRTKGSLDPRKGGGLTDSPASRRWRAQMVQAVRAARSAGRGAPETALGPIGIEALCFEPQGAAEALVLEETEVPVATARNTANGDLDKLLRNLLDALAADLKSGDRRKGADVFRDDCQVVEIRTRKLIEVGDFGPGILVRVIELDAVQVLVARSLAESMLWCAQRGFLPKGDLVAYIDVEDQL